MSITNPNRAQAIDLAPFERCVLLILLRHWDRPLSDGAIAIELVGMGWFGIAVTPERVEMARLELMHLMES